MLKKIFSIMSICLLLFSFTTSAYALPNDNLSLEPNAVVVCNVNGLHHVDGFRSFEKYAYSKGGTMYNATCYTCDCGSVIYVTDFNTYFFESQVKWEMTWTGVPYAVLTSSPYKFSGNNPPNWAIRQEW